MIRSALAAIDLSALQHNFQQVKYLAPDSRIMAVIKADAYGHGMVQVAQALSQPSCYADAFAVAHINEALLLRDNGLQQPLLVLQGFQNKAQLEQMLLQNIWPVIHQPWQLACLEACSEGSLHVWMKVNTGMGRLGFPLADARAAWDRLRQCSCVSGLTLMSHLANADDDKHPLNTQQITHFQQLASELQAASSLCNSAGIIQFPDVHGDWVRPGIMLYGSSPVQRQSASELKLRPVMQLQSRLIAINHLQAGDYIGYGSDYQCAENMPVGIVAIGYGDGYPRHLQSTADVYIRQQRSRILGRVSMDMLCIDLRSVKDAVAGDAVELWGENISVDEIAESAQTIAYELLCNMARCR